MLGNVCGVPPRKVSRYAGTDVTPSLPAALCNRVVYFAFAFKNLANSLGMITQVVIFVHEVLDISIIWKVHWVSITNLKVSCTSFLRR
jgi:hypothetical protein